MPALLLLLASSAPLAWPGRAQEPAELRARYEDWSDRDAEGRWALLRTALDAHPTELGAWIALFTAEGRWQELEWIAVAADDLRGDAAAALASADAPQWLRVQAWRLEDQDSHSVTGARQSLEARAGLFLAWARRHADDLGSAAAALAAELEAQGKEPEALDPEALDRYAPPITERELAHTLGRVGEASPFGDRLQADPDVAFDHQVLRAIATLDHVRAHGAELRSGLLLAAHERDDRIARAACLAFTRFPPEEVPVHELRALASDGDYGDARRGAAFLASTYGPSAEAYVHLHEVVLRTDHPHWDAAVSRLGELGDGFTVAWVAQIDADDLTPPRRAALGGLRDAAGALGERQRGQIAAEATGMIERAAFAEVADAGLAEELGAWTVDALRAAVASDPALAATLEELGSSYAPSPDLVDVRREPWMRDAVGRILDRLR